ncbi:hypothetical protein OC842_000884 [Tilletia horrida]|uniref:Uncharacterized protein n=1 Tax=Tilletia horrida TaxID=155126 RepID=A0AAN6GGK6_9BASI|nr:hypothetical protein OC842_000884 [Tilletia horrida]
MIDEHRLSSNAALPSTGSSGNVKVGPPTTSKAAVDEVDNGGVIKMKDFRITFIPQRLLDQQLPMRDPEMIALLSRRGCRVNVEIPKVPGTATSIQEYIKNKFKMQEKGKAIDIEKYGIQYAQFIKPGSTLIPLGLSADQVDAKEMESNYKRTECIIVPKIEDIDVDFNVYKWKRKGSKDNPVTVFDEGEADEDTDELLEQFEIRRTAEKKLAREEQALLVSSKSRPRARPVFQKPQSLSSSSDGSQHDHLESRLSPSSPLISNADSPSIFDDMCHHCAAPLGPFDDGHKARRDEHTMICPRMDMDELTFAADSESQDVHGNPVPGADPHQLVPCVTSRHFPLGDITGLHPSAHEHVLAKIKKYREDFGESAGFGPPVPSSKRIDGASTMDDEPVEEQVSCSCGKKNGRGKVRAQASIAIVTLPLSIYPLIDVFFFADDPVRSLLTRALGK